MDRDRQRKEDNISPSALSQASSAVLEWDPSADIGRHPPDFGRGSPLDRIALQLTSSQSGGEDNSGPPGADRNRLPSDFGPGVSTMDRIVQHLSSSQSLVDTSNQSSKRQRSKGSSFGPELSPLGRMASHLSTDQSGSGIVNHRQERLLNTSTSSGSTQYYSASRSRSQEEDEPTENPIKAARSLSMIELATSESPNPGRRERSPSVVLLSFEQVKTQDRQDGRGASSRESVVTTIMPSKQAHFDLGNQSSENLHSTPSGSPPPVSLPHSPIDINPKRISVVPPPGYNPRSPFLTNTSRAAARSSKEPTDYELNRPQVIPSDDDNVPGPSRALNREVSEDSTDWEYEHSGSPSRENLSSLSDWRAVGLTKSEIEYQAKLEDLKKAKARLSRNVAPPQRRSQSQGTNTQKNQQGQTEDSERTRRNGMRSQTHPITTVVSRSNQTTDQMFALSSGAGRNQDRDRDRQHRGSDRAGPSAPQRAPSSSESTTSPSDSKVTSDLTPTCSMLRKMLKEDPTLGSTLGKLVRAHKESHVLNMKKEIKGLKEMNRLLLEAIEETPSSSSSRRKHKKVERLADNASNVSLQLNQNVTSRQNLYYTMPEVKSPPLEATRHSHPRDRGHGHKLAQPESYASVRDSRDSLPKRADRHPDKNKPSTAPKLTSSKGVQANKNERDLNNRPRTSKRDQDLDKKICTKREQVSSSTDTSPSSNSLTRLTPTPSEARKVQEQVEFLLNKFGIAKELMYLSQQEDEEESTSTSGRNRRSDDYDEGERRRDKHKRRRDDKHDRNYGLSKCPSRNIVRCDSRESREAVGMEPIILRPVSYYIPLSSYDYPSNGPSTSRNGAPRENGFHQSSSLQDMFRQSHAKYIEEVERREAIMAMMKEERMERGNAKREYLRRHPDAERQEMFDLERELPPKGQRVMSPREMRERTSKKYKQLPEVILRLETEKLKDDRRLNRMVSKVFASSVTRDVLRGHVNHALSRSIIRDRPRKSR